MFRFRRNLPPDQHANIASKDDLYQRGYRDGYDNAMEDAYRQSFELFQFQDAMIHGLQRRIDAVSYTHLDVYKRQSLYAMLSQSGCFSMNIALELLFVLHPLCTSKCALIRLAASSSTTECLL